MQIAEDSGVGEGGEEAEAKAELDELEQVEGMTWPRLGKGGV